MTKVQKLEGSLYFKLRLDQSSGARTHKALTETLSAVIEKQALMILREYMSAAYLPHMQMWDVDVADVDCNYYK